MYRVVTAWHQLDDASSGLISLFCHRSAGQWVQSEKVTPPLNVTELGNSLNKPEQGIKQDHDSV